MTDIRKDFEELYAREYFSLADWQAKPQEEATLKAYMFDAYQAGRAHDVDGLIDTLIKHSGAFRDSENSGMIDIQRVISIVRKHFGKEQGYEIMLA